MMLTNYEVILNKYIFKKPLVLKMQHALRLQVESEMYRTERRKVSKTDRRILVRVQG